MRQLLAIALVAATAIAALGDDAFARRGRGADDGPGHIRHGRSADDAPGHMRRGRGADDGPGHVRHGRSGHGVGHP